MAYFPFSLCFGCNALLDKRNCGINVCHLDMRQRFTEMLELGLADACDVDLAVLLAREVSQASDCERRGFVSEHQDLVVFGREEACALLVTDHPTHSVFD
jgi:hypothetical protein